MNRHNSSEKINIHHRGNILIVDDDIDFAESLADILETHNYKCSITMDQDKALELVASEHPDVSLIDIRLKKSSGIDLIRRIKEKHPDLMCIIITAFASLDTAVNAIQQGAYDYLRKPIEIHDLIATLDRCFEKIQLRQEKDAIELSLKQRNLELEEALKDLQEEKEKFKTLVDDAPIGISIFGNEGECKFLNPKWIEMFGYDMDGCPTLSEWMEKVFPDPNYRQTITNNIINGSVNFPTGLNGDKHSFRSFDVKTKDGSNKAMFFRTLILKTDDFLMLCEDVTKQAKLEDQFNQAQKMEAVGTLAGGIAHDFNNLLQAIQGYSQLLLIDKQQNDPESAKLREILKASERASELTKQLLTFSRKMESKLRPINLNKILEQVHDFLHRTIPKMISMELNLEKNLHVINADPVQMEQVLINMAINARDAMTEGGNLVFKTANRYFDEHYCLNHLGTTPGHYVELLVSDTGHGLDMDVIDHIFEPFFTTKSPGKGTGLGLSMAYGIIKNHNGHIQCSSQKGVGTTFTIHIPAIDKGFNEVEEKTQEIMPPGGDETLLLVDDEPLLREIGIDMLSKFGYKVLTAPDGETALEIFQGKRSEISIIILDLIMPGMGGKRCMEQLLKLDPDAKIIISSGYSSDEDSSTITATHAKGFINKPYNVTQMLQVIRNILDN